MSMVRSVMPNASTVDEANQVSTRFLADKFPSANVAGLELSPFFVSVAQFKGKKTEFSQERILLNGCMLWRKTQAFHPNHLILFPFHVWKHPGFLRPGGTIAVSDKPPKSKILQVCFQCHHSIL
uniref:Uncharacterized protein n=1 Tax=Populus trichocarpa TaxID=3694 RepID=A0A2K1Y4H8_POPTR